jgi:hypothetical protein
MGRLVTVHHCPVCYYNVEDHLHYGTSGISSLFLRNHYALAVCRNCHNLVSVMVANSDAQTTQALAEARSELVQMEADAVIGDQRAREMLPLFREALDTFDGNIPGEPTTCTNCGSTDLEIYEAITGAQLDEAEAWIPCPRCDEGQLLIETTGNWD